ncbi:hypothetical protein A1Q1_01503 [Trichosporon asahii var. asahii CBS 2479]|uniref:F-box domain-containing protein n=1 Tax=Trichosporon asahii var. asahii (strain ATCC 90039 / CBS 2479 / JCM 2466 / KCTC 7840 / NBRC 103889/ NCYC 2677 / UAMH 7654) TaxID=1186058 RepID=J5QW34_TRIAS|nr:hypothetical protein A1Q1_01503 [Trichosporon asahii var. asahii CBS 2479]EJT49408.1 hypothetical protein A1Q1_01503 [Trichosporon asahii var. asahii CBS 2479]
MPPVWVPRKEQPSNASEIRDSVVNNREDVVSEVLSHLSSGDLATCMRVCRLWYNEAARFLYRSVKLDHETMSSFLYGISPLCDDVEPCSATMTEGIWKDCDHDTAERLAITSRPRTFYNFKAPLLRYVQSLTLCSHHRCACAPSGPLIHRLLCNLKLLRVVRSVCGCPSSCAINALCDSAACPFLNCLADKYVFRNNDGDCGAAASSRLDRHGFLYDVEGRDNRTTVVLPRTLGLLHSHGSADIAFGSALNRATSLKIVFADWEGCRSRPSAMTITIKDARVLLSTLADLLRSAPRCHEIVICGLERLELAETRGGEAAQIDADDLRSLKKLIEDHIRKAVWVQPVLPDSMVHSHDPHTGDIVLSFGSIPHHGGGNSNQSAMQGGGDMNDALPGAGIPNPAALFDSDVDMSHASENDGSSEHSDASAKTEDDSNSDSDYESANGEDSGEETDLEDDGDGDAEDEDEGDGGESDAHTGEVEDEEDMELEAASQELLAALASGFIFGIPLPPAGGPSTQGNATNGAGAATTTTASTSPPAAADAASEAAPASASDSSASNNSATNSGAGNAGNTSAPTHTANGATGANATHGPVNGQSLLAAFQEFVTSLTRTKPLDGQVVFQTFDEYLADDDSRGELSL